jgi:hypothetical protein
VVRLSIRPQARQPKSARVTQRICSQGSGTTGGACLWGRRTCLACQFDAAKGLSGVPGKDASPLSDSRVPMAVAAIINFGPHCRTQSANPPGSVIRRLKLSPSFIYGHSFRHVVWRNRNGPCRTRTLRIGHAARSATPPLRDRPRVAAHCPLVPRQARRPERGEGIGRHRQEASAHQLHPEVEAIGSRAARSWITSRPLGLQYVVQCCGTKPGSGSRCCSPRPLFCGLTDGADPTLAFHSPTRRECLPR